MLVRASMFVFLLLFAATLSACANATEPTQEPAKGVRLAEVEAAPTTPKATPEKPAAEVPEASVPRPKETAPSPKPPVDDQCSDQSDKVSCNGRADPPKGTPLKPVDTGSPPEADTPEAPQTKKVDFTVKFDPPVTVSAPAPIVIVPKEEKNSIEEWIRAILIPVILWLMSMLALYSVRRYRLIKSLYIDIPQQTYDLLEWLAKIEFWVLEKEGHSIPKKYLGNGVPLFSATPPNDRIYRESMSDIRKYLWGREIENVRATYSKLEELRSRLDIALSFHHQYKQLTDVAGIKKLSVGQPGFQTNSSKVLENVKRSVLEARDIFHSLVQPCPEVRLSQKTKKNVKLALLRVFEKLEGDVQHLRPIAQSLFYRRRFWYSAFCFLPLVFSITVLNATVPSESLVGKFLFVWIIPLVWGLHRIAVFVIKKFPPGLERILNSR